MLGLSHMSETMRNRGIAHVSRSIAPADCHAMPAQPSAGVQYLGRVHLQSCDRRSSAGRHAFDENRIVFRPAEVFAPTLSPRIEQRHGRTGHRVPTVPMCPLMAVAARTREGEVGKHGQPARTLRIDVVDGKRTGLPDGRKPAIFAPASRAGNHLSAQGWRYVAHLPFINEGNCSPSSLRTTIASSFSSVRRSVKWTSPRSKSCSCLPRNSFRSPMSSISRSSSGSSLYRASLRNALSAGLRADLSFRTDTVSESPRTARCVRVLRSFTLVRTSCRVAMRNHPCLELTHAQIAGVHCTKQLLGDVAEGFCLMPNVLMSRRGRRPRGD